MIIACCRLPLVCPFAGHGVIRTVGTEIDRLESELKVGPTVMFFV